MGKSESGRFLVLFKGGKRRVSPRFHPFVSNVNQGNEGRHSLDLPRAAKNTAGCESVWNPQPKATHSMTSP